MTWEIETERLILRDMRMTDAKAMFEMDADATVHKYLGNNPITRIEQAEEAIKSIQGQYVKNGIGRWAAIEKSSGNFIGWSGLKFITEPENGKVNFYDVGYRLMPPYWGKGYATESAKAAIDYGFETLALTEIIGMCHEENIASRKALEKCGLSYVEQFKWHGITCDWLHIVRKDWLAQIP